MRAAAFNVEAHDAHFAQNTPDIEWIPQVVKRKWVILTGDKCIARNSLEIDALMTAGGQAYLPKGQMRPSEFAECIIKTRVKLIRHYRKNNKYKKAPYIAKIKRNDTDPNKPGDIEPWIDVDIWQNKIQNRTRIKT